MKGAGEVKSQHVNSQLQVFFALVPSNSSELAFEV